MEQHGLFYRTNCPVCQGSSFEHFLNCKDYTVSKETFSIVACKTCGFKFTNPIPSEERIGDYYKSEEYISHSNTRSGLISRLYHIVRHYALKNKLSLVKKHVSRGTLLDYGCGTGMFLQAAGKKGWNAIGVEPSEEARRIASNMGVIAYPDLKEISRQCPDYSISAITMWHVLEHVFELHTTIESLKQKLSNTGVLIVAVPNHNSYDAKKYGVFWAAYDVPRHLYHFTPDSIERLLAYHGFRQVACHPMKFDSYYVSLLSEKYKTGKKRYIKGFFTGMRSNLNANEVGEYSSVIYVFRKR